MALYEQLQKKLPRQKRTGVILALAVIALCGIVLLLLSGRQPEEIKDNRVTIYASSSKSKQYLPANVFDNNPKTAWVAGGKNGGRFSWIKFVFSRPIKLSGIRMINGFAYKHPRHGDLYDKNNRAKSVRILLSDAASYFWVLKDNTRGFQSLRLPRPRKTRSVQIFFHSIYKTTLWNDLCISEIRFW